jgi:hypothetical protein
MGNRNKSITESEFIDLCQQVRANASYLPDDPQTAEEELMRRLVISIRKFFEYEDPGAGVISVENPPTPSAPYWVEIKRIIHGHNSATFDLTRAIRDNLLGGIHK